MAKKSSDCLDCSITFDESQYPILELCSRHRAADALYEALQAECRYWGSPPADKWSYDSVREDNWKRSQAAIKLADGNEEVE